MGLRDTIRNRELAEAVGFEPTVGFPLRSVSNRVLSASQPRFRWRLFNQARVRGQEGKRSSFVVSSVETFEAKRGFGLGSLVIACAVIAWRFGDGDRPHTQ